MESSEREYMRVLCVHSHIEFESIVYSAVSSVLTMINSEYCHVRIYFYGNGYNKYGEKKREKKVDINYELQCSVAAEAHWRQIERRNERVRFVCIE